MRTEGRKGSVVWLTGLSGSGKSTVAGFVKERLEKQGVHAFILDGDVLRKGLNKDLSFSNEDRKENIRRAGEVAAILAETGLIVICAFISPFREGREEARKKVPEGNFFEIHVKADLDTCEKRDTKGLYKKARSGEIPEFTGISSPYEPPENPELVLDTEKESVEACAGKVMGLLAEKQGLRIPN